MDKVRRREAKALEADGEGRLKGTWQLFLFNPENLPAERIDTFKALIRSDLKVAKAWGIRCGLDKMKTVAKMLKKKQLDGLLNCVRFPITNAVAEGFNSKIQSIKADARGFRNFLNFKICILFFCDKLILFPPPFY